VVFMEQTFFAPFKPEKCDERMKDHFVFLFSWGKLGGENRMMIEAPPFSTSTVFKMFSVHPPALKVISQSSRFRDGLMCTVGLTVKMKLRFTFLPRGLKRVSHFR